MRIAHPVLDGVRYRFEQVPHIVQERRDDEVIGRTLHAGEVRSLQAVLGHRYALAEVGAGAAPLVERHDLRGDAHAGTSASRRRSNAVSL